MSTFKELLDALKNASDCIKEGNGHWIVINSYTHEVVRLYIAINKGAKAVAEKLGQHRNTVTKIKNHGRCAPDVWEVFFKAMKRQAA
jgi:hypothetical protein